MKGSLQSNKEILASEFLLKFIGVCEYLDILKLTLVKKATNSVICMQVSYFKSTMFLKEFERIRRPGEDSFEITDYFIQFHLVHSRQKTCQFRSNCGLKVHLAGY